MTTRLLMDARITTLRIDNLPMDDVGRVLAALDEAGFEVEINISRKHGEEAA